MADLPEPYLSAHSAALILGPNVDEALYTADQLRAYAAAAVAAERERCVRAVYDSTSNMHDEGDFAMKEIIADAIRGTEAHNVGVEPHLPAQEQK